MLIATATPLIMAAIRAVSTLFGLNHCKERMKVIINCGLTDGVTATVVTCAVRMSAVCHVYLGM